MNATSPAVNADAPVVNEGLRHGDAFALIDSLADGAVDVTISDPPYDEKTHAGARHAEDEHTSRIEFPPLTEQQVRALVAGLLRVTRRWVICCCSLEQLGTYRDAAGDAWVRSGVWIKPDAMPQITGDRPGQGAEGVAIMHRPGRKRWARGGFPAVWTYGIERKDRVHPTQKPLKLMLALVADFSEPGELVFDPFAGSATTGVAALRTGRRFLGSDLDPAMHAVALERLAAEHEGQSLAAARAGQTTLFAAGG